ncbi:hypothetical protein I5P85_05740 [Pseudomonas putida]|nr:hypothetical protein [Pseudomonas putida]
MPKVEVVVMAVEAVMAADMEVGIQAVWEGTAEMAKALEAITLARPHGKCQIFCVRAGSGLPSGRP